MSKGVLNIQTKRMDQILKQFGSIGGKVPLALSRALNRSAQTARSESVRQVRDQYTAKAKTVRDTIRITKANPNQLQAKITSIGSPLRLYNFKVSPKKPSPKRTTPINVEVKKGSSKSLPGAFVANVKNGNTGVFSRVSSARLPIKQLYGPAVPIMMNNDDVVNAVTQKAQSTLENRIGHEINRILGV
jgi:hypothetical protein